jgi:aryl-alcohol dehydrogenase-like predicted oxidoreductase
LQKRGIGSLKVSVIGLGCNNFGWRIDARESAAVVDTALESGINFFDTADIYAKGQSEEYLGRALAGRRRDAVIATKFGMKFEEGKQGARPDYIHAAAEASLRRLGTDYIDLYQIHTPDPSTPIADTLGALDDLVRAGKVRETGCSNFSAAQIHQSFDAVPPGHARFASVQNHYSIFHREPEADVLPLCERLGIAFLPYFPLENGLLSGKYRASQPTPAGSRAEAGFGPKVFTQENLQAVEALIDFAASHGHSLLEFAISWLLGHKVVASVIAGAKSPEQVRANANAYALELASEEYAEIDRILPRHV